MSLFKEYTPEDLALHKTKTDLWIAVHGKVYDVTNYVRDHPGGADALYDVAGTDATAAYEDVGHSEDADEILKTYLIGTLQSAREFTRPKPIRVIQQPQRQVTEKPSSTTGGKIAMTFCSVGGFTFLAFLHYRGYLCHGKLDAWLFKNLSNWIHTIPMPKLSLGQGGFSNGFLTAASVYTSIAAVVGSKLLKLTQIKSGFTRYPSHFKSKQLAEVDPHLVKGFLEPKDFKELPLIAKTQLAPSVYRFIFALPHSADVIGLPIGQHVAIKANIKGQSVSRSYTPTSNNLDLGVLELVIRCYPDGLLTGSYLAGLQVGDKVLFRGPKGTMKYQKNLCRRIGMIAGGTGITPMYQLIRAICEDETDTTEISLIYANRTEEDILLREELERFARRYPKNLKIWYMLDQPPQKWKYGKGYVTPQVMADKLPAPSGDTKIMLCGPPGMINASKKALCSLGFQAPGSVSKMTDQIFCF
ncbi:cytochrome b5 reductase [Penicillium cataractarum]|uniref:Cytochrome b5 reductase n=1 Tax=Penicillium cataractarum TaxID=2100454 RepID=A0A9W9R7H2_9EURO|nr:cytochrome b5 reductase [Penicillium cataractarum]KAJ5355023.1 cytochrome b5 reductase [Penicillium cataractarum]